MKKYLKVDPWMIIEDEFSVENHKSSESIFSIGNGHIGQRANFEETYSGNSLQGSYVAGVYYPDKTKVGWWKNGYPEYFAKVLNSINYIGINIIIDDTNLDLAKNKILSFKRILNMKEGTLKRVFQVEMPSGKQFEIISLRFLSMDNPEVGVIHYQIKSLNADAKINFTPYLDGNVVNQDANWDEIFWKQIHYEIDRNEAYLVSRTKKTEFEVSAGMKIFAQNDGNEIFTPEETEKREGYVSLSFDSTLNKGKTLDIIKYISVLSSLNHSKEIILNNTKLVLRSAFNTGINELLSAHRNIWSKIWESSDVIIKGDDEAQQGIRFNIFQLNQTYTGNDERLNIGPKGFTGEKYGGASYWDTEAYCIPFFLSTAPPRVSRNLLLYRYKQLDKAIENAQKLGFINGAALFPMVTMNGEECHNEWEITFEEIHRNGAIAYAIYNYILHTKDFEYLEDYGLEVLIAISRFWRQRVNYSENKQKFVILGVTGPNEYENNVNNNWYTNYIAKWTLEYTISVIENVKNSYPDKYNTLSEKISFKENHEISIWKEIIRNLYLPKLENNVFLQQDGYMDKEQITVDQLSQSQRPINQKWSWDRILRSCFIKQADVLQGIYFFQSDFDIKIIEKNFDFYEQRTVHESSLSPCVHAVLAARLGRMQKAYDLYLRTSRLDLDDYNNEVHEGLHITSMAGTYMAIIEGFAGKRIVNDKLTLNPQIPSRWDSYSFKILFRNSRLKIETDSDHVIVSNESNQKTEISLYNTVYKIDPYKNITIEKKEKVTEC